MSMEGGGNLSAAIAQMFFQFAGSADITSAGGDSPKRNVIRSFDINAADFDAILEAAIRNIVEQTMVEKEATQDVQEGTDILGGAQDALGLVTGNLGANPMGLVRSLAPLLGPAMVALMAPVIFKFFIEELTRPGGLMDTRFRRDIEKEQFGFYNRQLQYDTQYGYRNVIIQGRQSFISQQGNFHASTFRDINEGTGTQYRLSRIEISDKALGIRDY